jgi:hypothetical protein
MRAIVAANPKPFTHLLLFLGEIAGIYEGADFVGHGFLRAPEPVNNWLVNSATRFPLG